MMQLQLVRGGCLSGGDGFPRQLAPHQGFGVLIFGFLCDGLMCAAPPVHVPCCRVQCRRLPELVKLDLLTSCDGPPFFLPSYFRNPPIIALLAAHTTQHHPTPSPCPTPFARPLTLTRVLFPLNLSRVCVLCRRGSRTHWCGSCCHGPHPPGRCLA